MVVSTTAGSRAFRFGGSAGGLRSRRLFLFGCWAGRAGRRVLLCIYRRGDDLGIRTRIKQEEIELRTDLPEGQKGWQRPPTWLAGRSLISTSQTRVDDEMDTDVGRTPRTALPHRSPNAPFSHRCIVLSHASAFPLHKQSPHEFPSQR
jgi:hypothetical protein